MDKPHKIMYRLGEGGYVDFMVIDGEKEAIRVAIKLSGVDCVEFATVHPLMPSKNKKSLVLEYAICFVIFGRVYYRSIDHEA